MITYVELATGNDLRFVVPIFSSEAPNYLVPEALFQRKLAAYSELQEKGRFIGHRFWTYRSHQLFGQRGEVRIESVSPTEPELYPDSYWQSINASQVLPINLQRRQGNRTLETVRVNIWDLVLEGEDAPNSLSAVATAFLPSAFTDEETTRLIDGIELAIGKSEELRMLFKQRVSEELADDYRCYIA